MAEGDDSLKVGSIRIENEATTKEELWAAEDEAPRIPLRSEALEEKADFCLTAAVQSKAAPTAYLSIGAPSNDLSAS